MLLVVLLVVLRCYDSVITHMTRSPRDLETITADLETITADLETMIWKL